MLAFLLGLLVLPAAVQAQAAGTSEGTAHIQVATHELSWGLDGPIAGGAVALTALAQWRYQGMSASEVPHRPLLPWDRPIAGTWSSGAGTASNALLAVGLAVPVLWGVEVGAGRVGGTEAWSDAAILAEVLALNSSLNLLVRSSELWARPLVFAGDAPAGDRNAAQARGSFYSGHASGSFALATTAVVLNSSRRDPLISTPLLATGAYGLAMAISVLRVRAGSHYPTDIAVGALVGSAIGWGVPMLHEVAVGDAGAGNSGSGSMALDNSAQQERRPRVMAVPQGIQFAWSF